MAHITIHTQYMTIYKYGNWLWRLPAAIVRTLVSFSPHVWVEGGGEVVRAEAGGADAPAGVKAVTAIITDTLHTMLVILHGDLPPSHITIPPPHR